MSIKSNLSVASDHQKDSIVSGISFTIPEPELKPVFRTYSLVGAAGAALSFFLRPGLQGVVAALGTAVLCAAILYFGYRSTLRYVWVTLSQEGVSGRGDTDRNLVFGWHESVLLVEQAKFGFKGVAVRRSEDKGMIKAKVASLFIPEAVLRLESFRAALARQAPASHPLRQRVGGVL